MTWCHFGNRICLSPALLWEMSVSDSAKSPCCTHQPMVSQLQNHWGHAVHSPCAPPTLSGPLSWPNIIITSVKCSQYGPGCWEFNTLLIIVLGREFGTGSHRCLLKELRVSFWTNCSEIEGNCLIECCSTSCVLKNFLVSTLPEVPVFFNHPSLPPKVVLLSYRTALAVGCSTVLQDVINCNSTIKTL